METTNSTVNEKSSTSSTSSTLCPNILDLMSESEYLYSKHKTVKSVVLALVVISLLFSFFYFRNILNNSELSSSSKSFNFVTIPKQTCRPFVLYSQQKSGTHYLMEVVHHSRDYQDLEHEILHNNKEAEEIRNQSSKVYRHIEKKLKGQKSFILQHSQAARFCPVWDYVKDNDYQIVFLVRDPYDAELSTVFYRQEDSAHCIKGKDCTVVESVKIDPSKFLFSYKRRYRHLMRQLYLLENEFPNAYLVMRYEDVVKSPEREFNKLFDFLNCPRLSKKELESKYIPKHKKKSLKDSVVNYKQFQSYVLKNASSFVNDKAQLVYLQKKVSKLDPVSGGKYPLAAGLEAPECQHIFDKRRR